MEHARSQRRTLLWLSLIVLLGLGLRLAGLFWGQGYCSIGPSDAMEAYSVTVDYANGEPRAQYLGQPNYNSHSKLPGPLWTLFCYAGLRLWGSIDGVVFELILLNTAAILLIYLLAQRTVGHPASLWAALLAATLPYPIYYSVSIYNPNVMVFLGGCLFLALWRVLRQERSGAVFWLPFLVLLTPQFHMCITMLLPAMVLIVLLAAPRLNLPWLFGGLLAGLLLYVPYLHGEITHGWQNTHGMMSVRSGYSWGCFKALTAPLSLLTNWAPQWTASFAEYRKLGSACFGWYPLFLAASLLSGLVALLLFGRGLLDLQIACRTSRAQSLKPKHPFGCWFPTWLRSSPSTPASESRALLFLAILITVPLLLGAVSGKNFRIHYALVLLPALLALAGRAAVQWMSRPRFGRAFTLAFALVVGANAWFMLAMFHHQSVRITRGNAFVGSFRQLESVYQQLKRCAGANRRVQIDDTAYFAQFTRAERDHLDAKFIRPYVIIREKESPPPAGTTNTLVVFELYRAGDVQPGDSSVAYCAHGIALKRAGTD